MISGAIEKSTAAAINPFGDSLPKAIIGTAGAEVESSRAVAEVHAAVAMAKRFPRNSVEAMDRILNAFTRQTLAEKALYSYARGGSDITGPSIRAAEAMAQHWGNLNVETKILEQRMTESTVQVVAWDLETNLRQVINFVVKHERHTKKGVTHIDDPRDVYELVANQASRRRRACILAVIPGDVTEAAIQQAEITLRTKVQITDELIQSLKDKFSEIGVPLAALEAKIQRRIQAITPALVVNLGKIYTSIQDGVGSVGDYFDMSVKAPEEKSEDVAQVKSKIASLLDKRVAEIKKSDDNDEKVAPVIPPTENAQVSFADEIKGTADDEQICQILDGAKHLGVSDDDLRGIIKKIEKSGKLTKEAAKTVLSELNKRALN